jgi:cation diffusion facilitator CzcD-associated flavoprotein CzcO
MLEFAIVGAGFGGIAMARALRRQGVRFVLLEKASAVGGTWRDNHYPGAACDVPALLYSLADVPQTEWSRVFPRQPELFAHLTGLASDWEASGVLRLGWQLREARWSDTGRYWQLVSQDGQEYRARHVVLALGGLHVPAFPAIPGLERFQGVAFHSAQWRHDVELGGRRVVVIGSGASAIQFIPEIAAKASRLTVMQRTPPWLLPRPDWVLPPWIRDGLARSHGLRRSVRGVLFMLLEALSTGLTRPKTAFWARALARRHLRRQIRDPALRTALTPTYPIGCKRVLISSDYYPALARSNVVLETTPIDSVDENGLLLSDGRQIDADVLILGTGFRPMDVLAGLRVEGRDGRSLAADWQSRPSAHLGIGVPGFPNLHFLLGPNTALGHNSVLYMMERQVHHILALFAESRRRGVAAVEPTEDARRAWLALVDQGFAGSAWAACKSWYVDDGGQNIALWTGSCRAYAKRLQLDPDEYRWF